MTTRWMKQVSTKPASIGGLRRITAIAVGSSVLALGSAVPVGGASVGDHGRAPSCSKASLQPYVEGVKASAVSFLRNLATEGGSSKAISSIVIVLAGGARLQFTFGGGHFTLAGSGVPAACKAVTATDDWEF